MEEALISFETAVLAKEKGFDIKVHHNWKTYHNELLVNSPTYEVFKHNWNIYPDGNSAPTQALLAKWLREVHKINIGFTFHQVNSSPITYDYCLHYPYGYQSKVTGWTQNRYRSYEDALEAALIEALKLIK